MAAEQLPSRQHTGTGGQWWVTGLTADAFKAGSWHHGIDFSRPDTKSFPSSQPQPGKSYCPISTALSLQDRRLVLQG